MTTEANQEEAIEGLQQLGLQEYEARCFVGLTRLSTGTAKKLSEITEVPRTRVYDAIRVLKTKGLVEIHHSSPQQFRAVPLEEAMETLRDQYESRVKRVRTALEDIENVESEDESPVQEVWSISGAEAIQNRLVEVIGDADEEILLVVGHQSTLSAEAREALDGLPEQSDILIANESQRPTQELQEVFPDRAQFLSGLEWIEEPETADGDPDIGVLLFVDRSIILVSFTLPDGGEKQAIYGRGNGNGFVIMARRIFSRGIRPIRERM